MSLGKLETLYGIALLSVQNYTLAAEFGIEEYPAVIVSRRKWNGN